MAAPGLQETAKKALATLDREWDGLAAHRDYPMISLDNNSAERALRRPASRQDLDHHRYRRDGRSERPDYLTAYLDACGHHGARPLTGSALDAFLPWNATPADLRTWAQPPPTG